MKIAKVENALLHSYCAIGRSREEIAHQPRRVLDIMFSEF